MPHTQRQQVGSRGRRTPLLLLLPLFSLLLSHTPQLSQAAIHIPSNYQISEFKKPPVITTQPESITVFGAEDILLTCEASGNPPPEFRWKKDGLEFIPANYPGLSMSPGSGTFMTTGAGSESMSQYQGKYSCYADNELGTAVSNEVQLITENTPALQKEKKVKKKVEEGESVILKCNTPFSTVPPVIHWMDKRLRHIELNDRVTQGRDGNLYFSHVTADDNRNDYTCNAQYLSARTILSKEPISLTVTTSNSVVRNRRPQMMRPSGAHSTYHTLRGQSLDLECIVQGLPTPTVQWVRKDGQLSESRTSRELSDRLLRFSNISESDGGEYQCSADNSQGKVTHTYTVSVEAAPYWTKEPVSQLYAPGETVRLDCQADGIPSPSVAWSMNGNPITGIDLDPRRTVRDGTLILRDVVFTDTAVYQCQAHNKHGTILVNTYIFVIELPPQILSADGQTYTVIEGQKAVLHCQTFGSPRPKVTWEVDIDASLLADPRVNLLTNGNLQITNVSHGEEGMYTCSISNTNMSINAKLEVLNRTVILSPPGSLRVQPGKTAIFTCLGQVDAKLTPPHIQWRRSGHKLFQSYAEDKYTFEGPDLIVANVQTEDEGVYVCEVITNLDMAEASGSITLVDRPDPPTQLQISDPKDLSVTLSWTAGDDHNSPVIEFLVVFEDHVSKERSWEELKSVSGTKESVTLALQPYMSYRFRVIAINDIGKSDPSTPSDLHSTPPQAPDNNPEDVRSESTDPDTLVITWEEMDRREFNGPEFHYKVFWRRVLGDGPTWHSNVTTEPPYIVTEVGNFSAFEIKVQAVNQKGAGPEPDPVIGYSGENVPLEAPMDVGVVLLNSTAIRVTWAAVDRDTVRGHLLGYKIHLTRFGSRGHHRGRRAREPESSMVVETGANEEKRVLGGLRPYSHYTLTVTVFNSKGEGPPSDPPLSFNTDEGAPGPPMSLHLDSPAETQMTLHWTPPAQPNGVLKGYLLQYQQIVESDDSPVQVETIDDHTLTKLTLKQLDPKSRYRFYLRGRTSAGDGEPITREGATTLDGAPPSNISLSVGEKSVNLSWVPGQRHRSVGFQVQYLNKNSGGKWKQSEKLNSSQSFYQLKGLTPGSQYRLRFTFSNNTFWETEIRTEGAAVVDVQSGFATQGWFIGLVSAIVLLLLVLLILCFIKRSKGGKYSVKDKEEGQVDSEARPMKDETFGEYRSLESDNEEKRTASQPSLCDESRLCTSEDNLDGYNNGSSAVTEVNMEDSLVSQYSRPSEATPDPGTLQDSSPLNPTTTTPTPTTNDLPNSAAI
ncbi:neural cell adhesion molecule L1-like isoform X1 [Coregonus clupeaformis]|uniref:neural cell adhesion molecule L1-like isoform X1 n=1 Tax=Coregonus clupeaformis TaxID=59861 RepID=UPI001E1C46A4|nr:neural cell adhesion molecule L1-like isoform X1 [Coregonus clupeaformis]XP_045065382.1 neural cell adhesion molecule L1-like isoform X1 [Coregonus clupeaformis]